MGFCLGLYIWKGSRGMELGGREILIALGALLIVAILLDGFRRVRRAGKGKLRVKMRVKRRRQPIFEGDDFDEFGSELPGGGARVVAFRDEEDAEQLTQTIKANRNSDPSRVTTPFLQAETPLPEDVETSPVAEEPVIENPLKESPANESDEAEETPGPLERVIGPAVTVKTAAQTESQFSLFDEEARALDKSSQTPKSFIATRGDDSGENKETTKRLGKNRVETSQITKGRASLTPPNQDRSAKKASAAEVVEDEVIILHLMAKQGEVFQGDELLKALVDNGLRYGSLKIFHRHEREDGSGNVLFSMANSVNPGTFDLNAMSEFLTPGVTFMMVLADSDDPLSTFNVMLECIHGINSAIGGELKDQQRSALSQQTAEHYRQRIMDFNRRRLTANV